MADEPYLEETIVIWLRVARIKTALAYLAVLLAPSVSHATPLGEQKMVPIRYTEALTAEGDPRLDFDKLLFVKRQTYHSSHFYTDFIDGCTRYGGNLCVLDLKTGNVTDLVPR